MVNCDEKVFIKLDCAQILPVKFKHFQTKPKIDGNIGIESTDCHYGIFRFWKYCSDNPHVGSSILSLGTRSKSSRDMSLELFCSAGYYVIKRFILAMKLGRIFILSGVYLIDYGRRLKKFYD